MDERIRRALERGHRVDITTIGRHSGTPRRIEIVFHNLDGRIWISGMPSTRTRAWIHNIRANPSITFHLKGPIVVADLPATARVVDDEAERRAVLPRIAAVWNRSDVDAMVRLSPLIEVVIPGYVQAAA